MEKHSVARIIGAPPGYVGYEEGGDLTEAVRRRPYQVILFDEIEKAHPDVFNILLQVLDEGNVTDSLGRRIDFKNTIIIMTSNIGTRQLKDFGTGVGFSTSTREKQSEELTKGVIEKALKKSFSPEFLNRIDDVIMFNTLSKEHISKIIDIELKGLFDRIESLKFKLSMSDKAKAYIAEKGYDQQFGARPLKRALQKYIEEPLAEIIIKNEITDGGELFVDLDEKESKLAFKVTNKTDGKKEEENKSEDKKP
jgi:ATP-dependent Clp protease ATP-binding subunit ClpC